MDKVTLMTKPSDDLKANLLQLSQRERAELAFPPISSLDDLFDADAETEWDKGTCWASEGDRRREGAWQARI